MRPIKGRLILTGLSLAAGLVGTLGAAPARAGTGDGPAIADPTQATRSHYSAGEFVDSRELLGLVQDGILDWDTALYLLLSGAGEPKLGDEGASRGATAPAKDDTGYMCDPHPDIPK